MFLQIIAVVPIHALSTKSHIYTISIRGWLGNSVTSQRLVFQKTSSLDAGRTILSSEMDTVICYFSAPLYFMHIKRVNMVNGAPFVRVQAMIMTTSTINKPTRSLGNDLFCACADITLA